MMRKMRRALAPIALAVALVTMTACADGTSGNPSSSGDDGLTDMEPVNFSITVSSTSPTTSANRSLIAFADEVTEKSDGKITFEVAYGDVLVPSTDVLAGVADGRADVAIVQPSVFPNDLPLTAGLFALGVDPGDDYPHVGLKWAAAVDELVLSQPEFVEEWSDRNLKVLAGVGGYQGYDIFCVNSIPDAASLEGRRVRAPGKEWAAQAVALGMTPVDLPVAELYDGLQRGVVDCAIGAIPTAKTLALWEVAPYVAAGVLGTNAAVVVVMNEEKYLALPEAARKIIDDATATLWREYANNWLNDYWSVAKEGVEDHGMTFEATDDYRAALNSANDKIISDLAANWEASGVADPEALIDSIYARLDGWDDVLVNEVGLEHIEADAKAGAYVELTEYADKMNQFYELYASERATKG